MESSWKDGLSGAGLYFDGIIEESKLQEVLELHKRDTVSTFGTQSSRRVSKNCNRTELQSNTKIIFTVLHYLKKSIQKCPKLYWKHKVGSHVIQFEDMPFSLGEKRTLDCQYGTKYYKSKPPSSDRVFLQGTRKKGCQAHIYTFSF